jgi:hypothetical protein
MIDVLSIQFGLDVIIEIHLKRLKKFGLAPKTFINLQMHL